MWKQEDQLKVISSYIAISRPAWLYEKLPQTNDKIIPGDIMFILVKLKIKTKAAADKSASTARVILLQQQKVMDGTLNPERKSTNFIPG